MAANRAMYDKNGHDEAEKFGHGTAGGNLEHVTTREIDLNNNVRSSVAH